MPGHNKGDVEDVEGHHANGLPQVEFAVDNEAHAKGSSNKKEADVTDKAFARNLKGADQGHGARDDSGNEAGSTDKLADSQTGSVGTEGGKGGEDIGAAVAKGEQGHAGQALAHAQHARYGVEVDAEEVACGNANGAEEEGEPERQQDKSDGLRVREATVVEGEVGHDASLLIGAVCAHKVALVQRMVDEAALGVLGRDGPPRVQSTPGWGLRPGPCQQRNEGYGEDGEGERARRVAGAAQPLGVGEDGQVVHGRGMLVDESRRRRVLGGARREGTAGGEPAEGGA